MLLDGRLTPVEDAIHRWYGACEFELLYTGRLASEWSLPLMSHKGLGIFHSRILLRFPWEWANLTPLISKKRNQIPFTRTFRCSRFPLIIPFNLQVT